MARARADLAVSMGRRLGICAPAADATRLQSLSSYSPGLPSSPQKCDSEKVPDVDQDREYYRISRRVISFGYGGMTMLTSGSPARCAGGAVITAGPRLSTPPRALHPRLSRKPVNQKKSLRARQHRDHNPDGPCLRPPPWLKYFQVLPRRHISSQRFKGATMTPPPLPFDIHARIIQFVYITSQSHEVDYETLSACALVCKDWVDLSQRLLFRRIPYQAVDHLWCLGLRGDFLLRALTMRPHLGAYVISIPVILDNFANPMPENPTWFVILRCCPYIAQLRLDNPYAAYTSALPKLLALSMHPTVLSVTLPMMKVVTLWPSVRHLVLETGSGGSPPSIALDFPLPAQLRSIAYVGAVHFRSANLPECATAAHYSAEELDVGRLCLPEHRTGGISIGESLRILACTVAPSNEDFHRLARLELLVLGVLPSDPVVLPRTLRHFGYHAKLAETIAVAQRLAQLVSALADESALPELRTVSVALSSKEEVVQAFERLRESRGVEVLVYADPQSYPVRCLSSTLGLDAPNALV
ncbi:hypothetical protein FA95DRAFT_1572075 [Auriscalpium vulgare]|uniref:Uncharacterized protein n=1 Tax=Auriscalpium vulgare TaxID=40419 RepID=A0ACB8RW97_9AGAM|nr:hypothetical protein FA95DRAFT_1572075 [Auriscalpium vulgare]